MLRTIFTLPEVDSGSHASLHLVGFRGGVEGLLEHSNAVLLLNHDTLKLLGVVDGIHVLRADGTARDIDRLANAADIGVLRGVLASEALTEDNEGGEESPREVAEAQELHDQSEEQNTLGSPGSHEPDRVGGGKKLRVELRDGNQDAESAEAHGVRGDEVDEHDHELASEKVAADVVALLGQLVAEVGVAVGALDDLGRGLLQGEDGDLRALEVAHDDVGEREEEEQLDPDAHVARSLLGLPAGVGHSDVVPGRADGAAVVDVVALEVLSIGDVGLGAGVDLGEVGLSGQDVLQDEVDGADEHDEADDDLDDLLPEGHLHPEARAAAELLILIVGRGGVSVHGELDAAADSEVLVLEVEDVARELAEDAGHLRYSKALAEQLDPDDLVSREQLVLEERNRGHDQLGQELAEGEDDERAGEAGVDENGNQSRASEPSEALRTERSAFGVGASVNLIAGSVGDRERVGRLHADQFGDHEHDTCHEDLASEKVTLGVVLRDLVGALDAGVAVDIRADVTRADLLEQHKRDLGTFAEGQNGEQQNEEEDDQDRLQRSGFALSAQLLVLVV